MGKRITNGTQLRARDLPRSFEDSETRRLKPKSQKGLFKVACSPPLWYENLDMAIAKAKPLNVPVFHRGWKHAVWHPKMETPQYGAAKTVKEQLAEREKRLAIVRAAKAKRPTVKTLLAAGRKDKRFERAFYEEPYNWRKKPY